MDLDPIELRVLGALIEKQRTTPDAYPLSLNALRVACNQSTNRDPVMAVEETQVRAACQSLHHRGLARLASSSASRTIKYRHLAAEGLKASPQELAVLAVLMLRGPQTPGELKTRTERLQAFDSTGEVVDVLTGLIDRGLAEHLDRAPGQKEARYRHLLGGAGPTGGVAAPGAVAATANTGVVSGANASSDTGTRAFSHSANVPAGGGNSALVARVDELERRIAALEQALRERVLE
jgi:uncharacterized protein YceH (UPF0502 family)